MDPNQIAPHPLDTTVPIHAFSWFGSIPRVVMVSYDKQIHVAKMSRLPVKHMVSIECTLNALSV